MDDTSIYTDIKSICREIRKPGQVKVYSVLMSDFAINKSDAIEFVKAHPNHSLQLIVWDDGEKRLELNQ